MSERIDRHLPLSGAYNFRDLGGYRTRSGEMTRWRRILRADSPHRLSKQDISDLLNQGLSTVIDLRSANEIANAPNPFLDHAQITYQNVSLFDHLAPADMRQGETSNTKDPLLDFYISTLANRQTAIRDILHAIACAQDGTVMFHCTAGKDRTGLISALLLGQANVEEDEIVSDYVQTKPLIVDLVQEFLTLARNNGTDLSTYRPLLECNAKTMRNVVKHIRDRYVSVPKFLTSIGLEADSIMRLSRRLLAD
jgi:protein-tyrosine phosphatase